LKASRAAGLVACCLYGLVAAGTAGCGRTKVVAPADSAADEHVASDTVVDGRAAEAALIADSAGCFVPRIMVPGLVCFGDDPAPYSKYLAPRDGGAAVGVCPAPSDFDLQLSEGDPGYYPCGGPLTPEQTSAAHDAGAPMTDAGGIVCCYWVEERWGV
jgi:hypothetical protein